MSDAAELLAALEAQHAAGAQEVAAALQDVEAQAAEAALRDAEVEAAAPPGAGPGAAAVPSDAEPGERPERPWPAADHPSPALPFHAPFRAPWDHPAAARPRWARFAHARQSLQTATQ